MPSRTALEHAEQLVQSRDKDGCFVVEIASGSGMILSSFPHAWGDNAGTVLAHARGLLAEVIDEAERRGAMRACSPTSNEDAEVIVWHRKRVAALEAELATEVERTKQLEAGIVIEHQASKIFGSALDELKKRLERERRTSALRGKALAGWLARHDRTPEGQLEEISRQLVALQEQPISEAK